MLIMMLLSLVSGFKQGFDHPIKVFWIYITASFASTSASFCQ